MAIHDQAAEREFVNTWEAEIIRWVTAKSPREYVDDYVQDVWAHLFNRDWRNLLKWKALYDDDQWHEHSLKSFLKTVTVNKVTDLQRAAYLRRLEFLDPADILMATENPGYDPQLAAEASRLMAAYKDCTSHYREKDHVLVSMWLEGHVAVRIAEELDTNSNNIHQRKSYLFNRLQDCLTQKLPEYFSDV